MPARHTLCLICQPLLMVRAESGSAHDDSQLLGGPAIATRCNPPRQNSICQGPEAEARWPIGGLWSQEKGQEMKLGFDKSR